jgi:hypothetical protein
MCNANFECLYPLAVLSVAAVSPYLRAAQAPPQTAGCVCSGGKLCGHVSWPDCHASRPTALHGVHCNAA